METDELRALQAPLKDRYTDEPGAALVTLSASDGLGEGVTCSVQTGRAIAEADEEQLATLLALTERYCVVYQTLAVGPTLETSLATG